MRVRGNEIGQQDFWVAMVIRYGMWVLAIEIVAACLHLIEADAPSLWAFLPALALRRLAGKPPFGDARAP